ncbi:ubiquitin C-terminal hydrolase 12-like [Lolium perenne]|uniref:ubiquitin C-terminal hydrolase 12-like n=1 Tax=Lolium perenne TaxID=4522 RepID=UPI0021F60C6A|nr:ubiquitin C-terminal hydrolase 12-like [Lolium perenne]XP_051222409.1 ubiquitin C-terminal hydrolase 12-like [Lolium perenne]
MGNSGSRAPPRLGKTYVPDFKWKIHDFSALLETKATSAISVPFDLSGYKWYLQVSPMHKKNNDETPYVAIALMLWPYKLEQGHTVHAVFEVSIYNHSNRMYCGCKADYNFDFKNNYSNKECLIPLQELLKSSSFLVDDSCVFGVEILKIDVSSPEKKEVVVQHKATTVQNFFVQKKGFVEGTYTWTVNNFHELELKNFFRSPTFEAGGHKWYICMYPRGDRCSTDCLSLHLCLDASNDVPHESKNVAKMTLSIQDQKNGKHVNLTTGLVVFEGSWGWPNFIPLKKFKDPSEGYLVESNCIVKADLTIVGSSNDG